MTCKKIYNAALALIGETVGSSGCDDYEARSLFLFGIIFSRYARLSEELSGTEISRETLDISSLDDEFPLDERLSSVAAETLASMLILDELPELSNLLNTRASGDAVSVSDKAVTITSTREVYGR